MREILARVESTSGFERAEQIRAEFLRTMENIALFPRAGHERDDLTIKPVLFWSVYSFLIAYRPDSDPLRVLRVIHGARDPQDLRGRVGEPLATYVLSGKVVVHVPLDARELEFIGTCLRRGDATNASELLLSAVRSMIDPVAEKQRIDDAWREDARRAIEIGCQELSAGKTVDGEQALERVRRRLDRRGANDLGRSW